VNYSYSHGGKQAFGGN